MSEIGVEALKLVFGIIGPIIAALVMALLVQLLRKAGISLEADKQAQINQLLFKLVAQTEEWAASKLKRGQMVTSADKAQYYLGLVGDHAAQLPDMTSEKAVDVSKQILGTAKLAAAPAVLAAAPAVAPVPFVPEQ